MILKSPMLATERAFHIEHLSKNAVEPRQTQRRITAWPEDGKANQ